ncbi:TPA: hypothetical protein SIA30_004299, partial [Aeromonas salmonicida]|nr:hypothetical protein [Aeromonas salmonicida]
RRSSRAAQRRVIAWHMARYMALDRGVEPGGKNMILPAAIDHQVIPGIALPLKAKALEQDGAAQGD